VAYRIPLFSLNFSEQEQDAVTKTLESGWISMGPNVAALEKSFQEHLGVKHAVAVTNCTAALHLALTILGVTEGDEVIVPSLTFVATVNAVRYVGATPVFVDIASTEDLSLNAKSIEREITANTKAIIPMHFGGFACDMENILALAKRHGLYVVEDAAHAPGSEYNGRNLGTLGDLGCFSLFSNKNITCGEGGFLVTDDDDYATRARLLRSHGMTSVSYDRATGHATRYDVQDLGYNYRLDDIRASIAMVQLRKLRADIERRERLRQQYLTNLNDCEEIVVPYTEHRQASSNYIFPIVLKDSEAAYRDKIRERLAADGIETSVHYPAVHRFSMYKGSSGDLPVTEYVTDNEITLPLYYDLTEDNIDQITGSLKQALANRLK
jgi:dTDP-4-amino-4,6-dideoxygalactose transaminase